MSKTHFILSVDYVREFLKYDPRTGVFVWLKSKARAKAGDVAGCLSQASGYMSTRIGGVNISLHRLALFYCSGVMPSGYVDHIDGDKTNNRLSNLREVSNKANCENRKAAQKNNKLGVLGVTASGSRFAATIKHHGKKIWIGTFDDAEEAHAAYITKKRQLHIGNTL